MNLPFTLPDWLPWWVPVLLLIPVLIYLVALLLMPFSVFGLKGRLDLIDARLDEIQGEIRALSLRLPESGRRPPIPPPSPDDLPRRAAPLPRAEDAWDGEEDEAPPPRRSRGAERLERTERADRPERAERTDRPDRAEPRLDWPR